jgi:DNA (cytosine-5)-methyltransferase 1
MADEQLTFGSLFSGIGGFDLGLQRAGLRCLWQCEIDPYAIRVLEKHWPAVLRVPDVRDVTRRSVCAPDLVCGGFPCQDISNAGPRTGIEGARSGLWGEMLRVVCELRPRYVLVENVAALLARGLGRVLGDLAASGYDAEWDCIPAAAAGAPHRRDRVWLLAYPRRDGLRDQPGRSDGQNGAGQALPGLDGPPRPVAHPQLPRLEGHRPGTNGRWSIAGGRSPFDVADPDPSGCNGRTGDLGASWRPEPQDGGQPVADPQLTRLEGLPGAGLPRAGRAPGQPAGLGAGPWAVESGVGRVAYGVPHRVDRLRSLGNALVPQIAEWLGERVLAYESQR